MRLITLTRGRVALIDDEDYPLISQYMWQAHRGRNTWYAQGRTYSPGNPTGTVIIMHRMILGLERGDPRVTDHINRNGLDNRRENLRAVTTSENVNNSPAHKDAFSKFKGVSYDRTSKRRKRWTAHIMRKGIGKRLGYYATEIEAAEAFEITLDR